MSGPNGAEELSGGLLADADWVSTIGTGLLGELGGVVAARAAATLRSDQETAVGAMSAWNGTKNHLVCPISRIYALVSARRIPHPAGKRPNE